MSTSDIIFVCYEKSLLLKIQTHIPTRIFYCVFLQFNVVNRSVKIKLARYWL